MDDRALQSLASALLPPDGAALGRYLDAVAAELGERSDAGLARVMDVSPSALANWRRRGAVTSIAQRWFQEELPLALARRDRGSFRVGTVALNGVMELLHRTAGDPLGVGRGAYVVTGEALPALFGLSRILLNGVVGKELHMASDDEAAGRLADLLAQAVPQLRRIIRVPDQGAQ